MTESEQNSLMINEIYRNMTNLNQQVLISKPSSLPEFPITSMETFNNFEILVQNTETPERIFMVRLNNSYNNHFCRYYNLRFMY